MMLVQTAYTIGLIMLSRLHFNSLPLTILYPITARAVVSIVAPADLENSLESTTSLVSPSGPMRSHLERQLTCRGASMSVPRELISQ